MRKAETRSILVGLESLMDLRQGTMLFLSEQFAAEVTLAPDYYRRTRDRFTTEQGTLERKDMLALLAQHPKEILKRSLYTRAHELLNELITRYQVMAATTPGFEAVSVHLNTYPFVLDDSEKAEILLCLNEHLGGSPVPIEMVSLSPKELSVEKIHSTYTALILYEWIEWLQLQGQGPARKPMRDVAFYFPRLQHGKDATDQQLKQLKKMGSDPFDSLMRVVLQPLMGAQWAPMRYFCATSPLNLPRSSLDD